MIPDSRRIYPDGELAGQLIGSVGIENEGLTGLEASFEERLHGSDGERLLTRDALGEEISRDTLAAATTGEDLQLTIDAPLQAHVEDVLAGIGETYTPKGATAIAMDPDTSEILALANWPPVEPSKIGEASEAEILNRATGFTYEPGSTFKAFTVAGALEDGTVTPRPPSRSARRSRSPTARSRSRTRAAAGRSASPTSSPSPRTSARSRSASRSASSATTSGSASSASASPPASRSPARSRGSSSTSTTTPARRWATSRSARASR